MMKVIGLTGGIGSGKSTVSQLLAEFGAVIIDADRVGHEAYQPGTETWQALVDAFGEQILAYDKNIDRKQLGSIVFKDPESLKKLNGIVHPRMYEMMKGRIEGYRQDGQKVVVLDAAILLEAGWDTLVDEIWVTVASEDVVIERAVKRTGLPEEQIRSRIRSQLSNEERIKHAGAVIYNDGDLQELKEKVKELWQKIEG